MFIAQKLRSQNLIAYVIYMFQVEDTIRAYGLDIDRICKEYLPQFGYSAAQNKELREWYEGLIRMMREERKEQGGHVQVVRNTLTLMAERHRELLNDPKQTFYLVTYQQALPSIVELRAKGKNKEKDEIENCLEALYGASLLKMQGKSLSPETQRALQPITHLLESLNELYKGAPEDSM